jgi:hypothetical protein
MLNIEQQNPKLLFFVFLKKLLSHNLAGFDLTTWVARWFLLEPKIPILVNFGGP